MEIYGKLVRDNIPEIIKKENKIPTTRILSNDEYKLELLKKLVEEANEVLEAKEDENGLIKELGDLLEVIDSTIKAFNLSKEEVLILKDKRKQERGGFDKQIFLKNVE
jgi:predicted house-cleaning noncanonical NTP pyrophosphatase (MazG superfamily)